MARSRRRSKIWAPGSPRRNRAAAAARRVDRAFTDHYERVLATRSPARLTALTTEEAFQAGIHGLALEEIRDQIHRAHKLLEALPDNLLKIPDPHLILAAPTPPIFWIHAGIKAAVAVTAALFLDDWLHPPGGTIFVLGAWTFTSRNEHINCEQRPARLRQIEEQGEIQSQETCQTEFDGKTQPSVPVKSTKEFHHNPLGAIFRHLTVTRVDSRPENIVAAAPSGLKKNFP